jgi:ABC-type cobalamin/Fe3+-siderophores transport system ATPase subunit
MSQIIRWMLTLAGIAKQVLEQGGEARDFVEHHTEGFAEFKEQIETLGGFFEAFWCRNPQCEKNIKEETKATIRCIPLEGQDREGACLLCGSLSRTRVILARALAQQPLLLLLDEPTLHLDIGAQVDLLDNLRRLAATNRYTVVIVTHELNLVGEYADQVVLLQKGRCLRVGTPASVFQRDLLEQVFQTQLTVEAGSNGRPRVNIFSGQ